MFKEKMAQSFESGLDWAADAVLGERGLLQVLPLEVPGILTAFFGGVSGAFNAGAMAAPYGSSAMLAAAAGGAVLGAIAAPAAALVATSAAVAVPAFAIGAYKGGTLSETSNKAFASSAKNELPENSGTLSVPSSKASPASVKNPLELPGDGFMIMEALARTSSVPPPPKR